MPISEQRVERKAGKTADGYAPAASAARFYAEHEAGFLLMEPTPERAKEIQQLIARCSALDKNSLYCTLLLCSDFAATCLLADQAGTIVGWLSAYRRPTAPSCLFVWQVAVHPAFRRQGLGRRLITTLLCKPGHGDITHLAATVTAGNTASQALFASLARLLASPLAQRQHFDRVTHFRGHHASEYLITIGPFQRHPVIDAHHLTAPGGLER